MVNPHGDGNDLDFVDVPQFQAQLGSGLGSCALGVFLLSYSQGFLGQTQVLYTWTEFFYVKLLFNHSSSGLNFFFS